MWMFAEMKRSFSTALKRTQKIKRAGWVADKSPKVESTKRCFFFVSFSHIMSACKYSKTGITKSHWLYQQVPPKDRIRVRSCRASYTLVVRTMSAANRIQHQPEVKKPLLFRKLRKESHCRNNFHEGNFLLAQLRSTWCKREEKKITYYSWNTQIGGIDTSPSETGDLWLCSSQYLQRQTSLV